MPDGEGDITAGWMSRALSTGSTFDFPNIASIRVESAGFGFMGKILRCHIGYEDTVAGAPESVVVKLPSANPMNRRIALKRSLYRREYEFYRRLAPQTPIRTPALFYSDYDAGSQNFVLVMEDLGGMDMADQLEGATPAQASCSIRAAATLQGHYWGKSHELSRSGAVDILCPKNRPALQVLYLACLGPCLDRFGSLLSGEMSRLIERYGTRLAAHFADMAARPRTLVHGDFRCENMFFATDGADGIAVIDWQVCGIGLGLYDVAYFLGDSVTTQTRRDIERDAVAAYHDILCRMGVKGFSYEDCWRQYREVMLAGLMVPVIMGGALDWADERSLGLVEIVAKRRVAAIDDLDAVEFMPHRPRIWSLTGAFSALTGCAYRAHKASRGLRRTAG